MPAFNYIVPGRKPVYAQPTGLTCWSAAYTMLMAWHDQRQFHSIRQAITPMGQPWLGYFDTNTAIPPQSGDSFVAATGLVREPRLNPDLGGWMLLLRRYGLLWVSSMVPAGLHDRVMAGVGGDGSPGGSSVYIMDPDGGRQYEQNFGAFMQQFEGQAGVEPFYSDYQILHYAG